MRFAIRPSITSPLRLQSITNGSLGLGAAKSALFRVGGGFGMEPNLTVTVSDSSRENDMNWDQIEGKWKQFTGSARERWGKLTDNDWETIAGKKDQLVGRIQERYGVANVEAEKQADQWSNVLKESDQRARATTRPEQSAVPIRTV